MTAAHATAADVAPTALNVGAPGAAGSVMTWDGVDQPLTPTGVVARTWYQ